MEGSEDKRVSESAKERALPDSGGQTATLPEGEPTPVMSQRLRSSVSTLRDAAVSVLRMSR